MVNTYNRQATIYIDTIFNMNHVKLLTGLLEGSTLPLTMPPNILYVGEPQYITQKDAGIPTPT